MKTISSLMDQEIFCLEKVNILVLGKVSQYFLDSRIFVSKKTIFLNKFFRLLQCKYLKRRLCGNRINSTDF